MKSIDTYLCRNTKKPTIEFYDMDTSEAVYSDGSRQTIYQIHERLIAENPGIQIKSKLSDGLWPLRLFLVVTVGWVIYKGLSH